MYKQLVDDKSTYHDSPFYLFFYLLDTRDGSFSNIRLPSQPTLLLIDITFRDLNLGIRIPNNR